MKKANPFLDLPDSKNIQDLKEIELLLNSLEKIHLKLKL